jgi:NAD(P)-dependent dehydrogenase (short-subunit alcohol dehydrogenase family)
LSCVECFLDAGFDVCLADMNEEIGQTQKLELSKRFPNQKVEFCLCDVTKTNEIENAVKKVWWVSTSF